MGIHRAGDGPEDAWTHSVIRHLHPGMPLAWHQLMSDEPREESNRLRLRVLHHGGGLWLDNDVVPLRRLTGAEQPWVASLGGRPEGCAMWFPRPGHPFLSACLERLSSGLLLADVMAVAYRLHPVDLEPRVLPFDATGRPTGVRDPWAVHHWATSSGRAVPLPRG